MYFKNLHTESQIKAEYRRLAFIHHPDRGGSTAEMQAINAAYKAALKACDGQESQGADGKQHTYRYNADVETAVMDKIDAFLRAKLAGVELLLVGKWLWISGETKPLKDKLGKNGLGFKWHSKRAMWFWHCEPVKRRYNSKADFNQLCETYGVRNFEYQAREVAVI